MESRKFALSLIVVLAFVFNEMTWVNGLDCDGCGCHSRPTKTEIEQFLWDLDAYNFLHSDDELSSSYIPMTSASTANYWLDYANRLYLAGSYEQAAASYTKAVGFNPSLLDGWLNLGNSLYLINKYEDALNAYDAALKIEPQNSDALQGKKQALFALNRTNETNDTLQTTRTLQGRKILKVGAA